MSDDIENSGPNFNTVLSVIQLLEPLPAPDREHVLRTIATWFRVGLPVTPAVHASSAQVADSSGEKFANRPELSAKEFIFEKDPTTEAERLACLAYYLTHYLDTPHFKTVDLSRLNTEAAQRKLSNPAVASSNAMRDGFFVQAPKAGYKQLSAMGERFVQLLPNREAAQQVKHKMASRRRRSGGGVRTETTDIGKNGEE